MQELVAYHGTKNSNINNILENGFNPSISTIQKNQWLGRGVYFFEDLYYAVEWNFCCIKNKVTYEELCNEYGIIEVRIDIENYNILDLNSGLGYDTYKTIIRKIKSFCNKKEIIELEKDGDTKVIRIIEKIEEKVGINLISQFDVVSALYPKNIYKKQIKHLGDFFAGVQRQICVKNQEAIIKKEKYQYKQGKIKRLYCLIIENRRKK